MTRVMRSLAVLSALIVASGAVLTVKPSWDHPLVLLGRIAVLGLILGLLFRYVFKHTDIAPADGEALGKPRPTPPREPAREEILEAYASLIATYDKSTLDHFVNMLIDLPHYLVRINEDAEILGESPQLRMTTRQLYRLSAKAPNDITADITQSSKPKGTENEPRPIEPNPSLLPLAPDLLLVPLIRAEKGTLFDNLEVSDARGSSVPTLSNNHVKGLIAYTLDVLLRMTPSMIPNLTDEQVAVLESKKDQVLSKLVMVAWSPGPWIKQPNNIQEDIERALKAISELPVDQGWKDRLSRICEHFRDNYQHITSRSMPSRANMCSTIILKDSRHKNTLHKMT
jgi:hypothetical protein